MAVTIEFNLPFSLIVDGNFHVISSGYDFGVNLTTIKVDNPNFPGLDNPQNIYIINDDTNIIWYTRVIASYDPPAAECGHMDPEASSRITTITLALANTLIMGTRIAFGEHVKEFLYHQKRISPIQYHVSEIAGQTDWVGISDSLMGGITNVRPTRTLAELNAFEQFLASGVMPSVSVQLYSDARRYLIHRNFRMAMANLVMSFELGLAEDLARVAIHRGDLALESSIMEATIGGLGQNYATRTLGQSFDRADYWGQRFYDTYEWLRLSRNKVLHRSVLTVNREAVSKDFSDSMTIQQIFDDRDWLKGEIENAVSRVISGLPPRP